MADQRNPGAAGDPQDDDEYLEEGPNCLLIGVGSFISGGVLGGLVGLAGGIFKRNGLKAALQEGGTSAKTFALMSGVHTLVTCGLQRVRKTEDVINQSIAGCASGIALGLGGPPSTMLINCAGFAAFAFLYEMLTARTALAATMSRKPQMQPLPRKGVHHSGPQRRGGGGAGTARLAPPVHEEGASCLSAALPGACGKC